jgi:DNA-binding transcriptional ArsR family regulator
MMKYERNELRLHQLANLLADQARCSMLACLLDRRALTAGELALRANVSPQAASAHLTKLTDRGLIALEKQGRHRYFRLANVVIAEMLEALGKVCALPDTSDHEAQSPSLGSLRLARSCYDHLAGKLAVDLTDAMLRGKWVTMGKDEFKLSPKGHERLTAFGLDTDMLAHQRRSFARRCLDWTERRPHIAGALGGALLKHVQDLKWVVPLRGSRALRVTQMGLRGFEREFGVRLPALK